MQIAQVAAQRSTCQRLNVGAVLVKDRSVVAIGYNGAPSGAPHCAGNNCPGKFTCQETTHAEMNAFLHLPESVDGPLDLYVTDSPCTGCFQAILEDGRIKRIFYLTPYRIIEHLTDWDHEVKIYRMTPAGYITDVIRRELVDVET